MTVPATARRAGPFTGNGVTLTFPFTFKVFSAADIRVDIATASGVTSVGVLNDTFTATINPDQTTTPGGTVSYAVSGVATALPTGYTLAVTGARALAQTVTLPTGGAYQAATVEAALDSLQMQIQQVDDEVGRSLTLSPLTPTGTDTTLPAPEANKLIGWNETATGLQNLDAATLASMVAFGTAAADQFTGTGSQTVFTLSSSPGALANLHVAVGGVVQRPTTDYTWASGTTLTFTSAPPAGVVILVQYMQALPQGTSDSAASTFLPGGTGAATRTVQDKLRERVSLTDFGAVSGTDCTTAINNALAYLTSVGGGTLWVPVGSWGYSAAISVPANVWIIGASMYGSVLLALNGTTAQITLNNARGGLESLCIRGPYTTRPARIAAPSSSIGVIDRGANIAVRDVRVEFFKVGWSKTIGYWCDYYGIWLENNGTGWSWDNTASDFCNLITFIGCTFRANDRNGIASTAATNNTAITYIGCDVESNCGEDPLTYPQIALFNARSVTWLGGYAESNSVSPAPDFWNLQNTSIVKIDGMYLSGARKAFFSGSNGSGTVEIKNIYWAGGTALITSAAYDFPSCTNVRVWDFNTHTASITLSGSGSQLIASGNLLATRDAPANYTPVLSGTGTAGTFTYANQTGRYSRNGNIVTVAGRVTITAITVAPTGNIQISLPLTSVNAANVRFTGVLDCSGVSLSGSNTYFYGRIDPSTSQMTLFQGGVTATALVAANITATASVQWSISYEV